MSACTSSNSLPSKRPQALANLQSMCNCFLGGSNPKFSVITFCQLFSQNEVHELLFQLLDDTSKGKLVQSTLIDFLNDKLGSEGKGFVDLFDTLAYVIAGDADLDFPLFSRIFRTEKLLAKLFRLMDVDGCGQVSVERVLVFTMNLTLLKHWKPKRMVCLQSITDVFSTKVANDGTKSELSLEEFKQFISCKDAFFAERIFRFLDTDNSNGISSSELREGLERILNQTDEEKIRFLFKIYDRDGDGLIQLCDVKTVLKACIQENQMSFSDDQMDQMAQALYEDAVNCADTNKAINGLEYHHVKAQLDKHPGLVDELSFSLDRFLLPSVERSRNNRRASSEYFRRFLGKNSSYTFFIVGYILVNAALIIARVYKLRDEHKTYMLARTFGQLLNFNCSLVTVLMLRQCITWLRRLRLGWILPLDAHVELHKLCGVVITISGILHGIMHSLNFSLNVANQVVSAATNQTHSVGEWLFTMKPGTYGLIPGISSITGWVLWAILAVMIPCSLPFVRKSGYFELFYWTHLLYVPFWILSIFHSPQFWHWFVVPGTLFATEHLLRFARRQSGLGKTNITHAVILPSRVTHLVIRKPPNFHFHPGDYVYVNIPKIAAFEWHPFTISSAPELPEVLWLHIRVCGGWTSKLYEYFKQQQLMYDSAQGSSNSSLQSSSESIAIDIGSISSTVTTDTNTTSDDTAFTHLRKKQAGVQRDAEAREPPFRVHPVTQTGYRYIRQPPQVINLAIPSNKQKDKFGQLPSEGQSFSQSPRVVYAPETLRMKNRIKSTMSFSGQPSLSTNEEWHGSNVLTSRSGSTKKEANQMDLPLEITVDGPYGAPSSHIFRAEHAVLIAAGIGVTPFASILQSIMHRYYANRQTCPCCRYSWANSMPDSIMNLKKVDFFWINRDQSSFEWFVNLLSQLEMEQAEMGGILERFLDLHMYITSALKKTDIKAVGLQMALDLLHAKEKRDLLTGLKTRTNSGRPNWNKVFQQLVDKDCGKITVFYCGPPQLAKVLKKKCNKFGFEFRKEIF